MNLLLTSTALPGTLPSRWPSTSSPAPDWTDWDWVGGEERERPEEKYFIYLYIVWLYTLQIYHTMNPLLYILHSSHTVKEGLEKKNRIFIIFFIRLSLFPWSFSHDHSHWFVVSLSQLIHKWKQVLGISLSNISQKDRHSLIFIPWNWTELYRIVQNCSYIFINLHLPFPGFLVTNNPHREWEIIRTRKMVPETFQYIGND